jgi:hypothetical protein
VLDQDGNPVAGADVFVPPIPSVLSVSILFLLLVMMMGKLMLTVVRF